MSKHCSSLGQVSNTVDSTHVCSTSLINDDKSVFVALDSHFFKAPTLVVGPSSDSDQDFVSFLSLDIILIVLGCVKYVAIIIDSLGEDSGMDFNSQSF